MLRMRKLEEERGELPVKDIEDNLETAIKSALYMALRHLYNDKSITSGNRKLHGALFLFIRNYAYSGMFRYNSRGDFNVPYGGIGYNSKSMRKKLDYYLSAPLHDLFTQTTIFNQDFEVFLKRNTPSKNDFIFLDPPYDSEFSTYAQNEFTQSDQQRLANYLLNECQAKWMLVIKNTDFIFGLYNKDGIHIRSFEKSYAVSFMNRNDKRTTHLLITNYSWHEKASYTTSVRGPMNNYDEMCRLLERGGLQFRFNIIYAGRQTLVRFLTCGFNSTTILPH